MVAREGAAVGPLLTSPVRGNAHGRGAGIDDRPSPVAISGALPKKEDGITTDYTDDTDFGDSEKESLPSIREIRVIRG